MKNKILILVVACVAGCTVKDTPSGVSSRAESVLADFTDKRTIWPSPGPILSLFDFKTNPQQEAWFHLTVITDKKYNTDYTVYLPSAQVTEKENSDDPQARNIRIVSFYDSVRHAVAEMYNAFDTTRTFGNSEIFASICHEIQWLQSKHVAISTLIVFSNLIENSAIFSAYAPVQEKDIPAIIQKFEAANLLPQALQNLTIYFVNAPVTKAEDSRYSVMLSVYKHLLESCGAKVIVQANNQSYLP